MQTIVVTRSRSMGRFNILYLFDLLQIQRLLLAMCVFTERWDIGLRFRNCLRHCLGNQYWIVNPEGISVHVLWLGTIHGHWIVIFSERTQFRSNLELLKGRNCDKNNLEINSPLATALSWSQHEASEDNSSHNAAAMSSLLTPFSEDCIVGDVLFE